MLLDWRQIPIALIVPVFGEQTAQACANAWFRQLSIPDFKSEE